MNYVNFFDIYLISLYKNLFSCKFSIKNILIRFFVYLIKHFDGDSIRAHKTNVYLCKAQYWDSTNGFSFSFNTLPYVLYVVRNNTWHIILFNIS